MNRELRLKLSTDWFTTRCLEFAVTATAFIIAWIVIAFPGPVNAGGEKIVPIFEHWDRTVPRVQLDAGPPASDGAFFPEAIAADMQTGRCDKLQALFTDSFLWQVATVSRRQVSEICSETWRTNRQVFTEPARAEWVRRFFRLLQVHRMKGAFPYVAFIPAGQRGVRGLALEVRPTPPTGRWKIHRLLVVAASGRLQPLESQNLLPLSRNFILGRSNQKSKAKFRSGGSAKDRKRGRDMQKSGVTSPGAARFKSTPRPSTGAGD